jgi:hypothetical protein
MATEWEFDAVSGQIFRMETIFKTGSLNCIMNLQFHLTRLHILVEVFEGRQAGIIEFLPRTSRFSKEISHNSCGAKHVDHDVWSLLN